MKRSAADDRFSKYVRSRDDWTCQRCFAIFPEGRRGGLDCAHMFGRGKMNTRFDPENAAALCFGCHRWLDTHPELKREFFLRRLGSRAFAALEIRSNLTKKDVSIFELAGVEIP
ncbi:MAG TPA: hypothetical protein VFT76_00190 [Actinomycetota bacterium]|nr:hypothetical protein [Actinomycetota bacterium]